MSKITSGDSALKSIGLTNLGKIHWNLPVSQLIEHAICNNEAILSSNGAIAAYTGKRTGRSPKDKFIVKDAATSTLIDWGDVNLSISSEDFGRIYDRLAAYLQGREVYVTDAWAGADPSHRYPVRIITELAWHNLFAKQLFRKMTPEEHREVSPEFTVVCTPNFQTDPAGDRTHSEATVMIDFSRRIVAIAGTHYAGEIKKSIFTVLNYLLPLKDVLPMHCSANIGAKGDVALFFGLSGTGKTTLSADPFRKLIGDDEHGWGDSGVFNFEGGCYAKCIRLSQKYEPQIWNAVRYGTVFENVILDPATRIPRYDDDSLTENTRAAYPLEYIDDSIESGTGGHPKTILFLTADAFGVMPPISKLTTEQAIYYFLSGYTAKLAGTEAGLGSEPQATFSTCFGAPFFPLPPTTYSRMLRKKIDKYGVQCYLVNTGWIGGRYGVGQRINLSYTRAMVEAALNGQLADIETITDPIFGLHVPVSCPDVPAGILNARSNWKDTAEYDRQAWELAKRFADNFTKFADAAPEVKNAGPAQATV